MAYREFHFEKTYASPDVGILERGLVGAAERSAEAIGNIFKSAAEAKKAKQAAADQYKVDFTAKKFHTDDIKLFAQGVAVTEKGKNEIRTTGRISPETENYQNMSLMNKQQSEFQWKRHEQNLADIARREKDDVYFDGTIEYENANKASYGDPGQREQVDFRNRGSRLDRYDQIKFTDPRAFRGKVYTSDYVKTQGIKVQAKDTGSPTSESSSASSTPFRNAKGLPEVTTQHAKDYLNSRPDGSVARWIENKVEEEMDADVRYMKQREPDVFKGMSDDAIKLYLKANPQDNLYNQKDFAQRVIDKAKYELNEAAAISNKTDYETKVDKSASGGVLKTDAWGHSYTHHTDAPGDSRGFAGPFLGAEPRSSFNSMPGGNLRQAKGQKMGQAIPLNLNPRSAFDVRTGKNQKVKGTTSYNVTGYQIGARRKDGSFYETDDVNKIPYSAFKDMEPELQPFLRGFTIDQGNKLGEIASRQSQLDAELGAAMDAGDVERQADIQLKINNLQGLRQSLNASPDDFSDEDMLGSMKKNGISVTSIQRDVLIPLSQPDNDLINGFSGLNLYNQEQWSPEMVATNEAYKARYQAAAAAGFQDPSTTPKKPAAKPAETPKATSVKVGDVEYEPAPPGRIAVQKPDGSVTYVLESQRKLAESKGYKVLK